MDPIDFSAMIRRVGWQLVACAAILIAAGKSPTGFSGLIFGLSGVFFLFALAAGVALLIAKDWKNGTPISLAAVAGGVWVGTLIFG